MSDLPRSMMMDDYKDTIDDSTHVPPQLLLDLLPIPHFVIDNHSRLHSFNPAARDALGLESGFGTIRSNAMNKSTNVDSIFWTSTEMPGSNTFERVRNELQRLSRTDSAWGSSDAIELKSGASPGLRWWAEAKVRAFVAPQSNQQRFVDTTADVQMASRSSASTVVGMDEGSLDDLWFSITLLRPIPGKSELSNTSAPLSSSSILDRPSSLVDSTQRNGSSSDRTPTLLASEMTQNPFADAWAQPMTSNLSQEMMPPPTPSSALSRSAARSSEANWANSVAASTPTQQPPVPSLPANDEMMSEVEPKPVVSGDVEMSPPTGPVETTSNMSTPTRPNRPNLPLRLSALPSPSTPPLSSAGTSSSKTSRSSLLSGVTHSSLATSSHSKSNLGSSGSFAASANSSTIDPDTLEKNPGLSALAGFGVTVSSAGIHLSTSSPPVNSSTPVAALHPTSAANPLPATLPSSPRPTALPPPLAKPQINAPEQSHLLKFAALSCLPKTGVIIADSDVASGFVNALARELLMGVPAAELSSYQGPIPSNKRNAEGEPAPNSTAGGSDRPQSESEQLNDWWAAGSWSSEDGWSAFSSSTGSSSFFPPQSSGTGSSHTVPSSAHSDRLNPFELPRDLTHASIIASGEAQPTLPNKGTAGSSIRIGKPAESNRYRATVAAILARSLASDERRRAGIGPNNSRTTPGGSTLVHEGKDPKDRWASTGDHDSAAFVAAGSKQGKKPYKVFDHSFSQRIIDPFEPMLEICARRGEYPTPYDDDGDDDGGASSGMIVGIEVEVWESAELLKPGSFVTATSAARKKRVRRRLVEISGAPIFAPGKNGGPSQHLGGVLLLRDVTDDGRKRAGIGGLALKDASKKKKKSDGDAYYKQIVDSMPQLVWTTSVLGSHTYFNQQWYAYTNLEPEQSLGVGWQSPFHEDDMPAALKAWTHSLETGDPYSVEYRCRRGDGAWRWMLGRALPLRDADGVIQSWFGTCTDVDEFVNIRTQLSKTQEQFKAIIEGADVLIFAIDTDWRCTFFQGSHRASIIKSIPDGKIEGKNVKAVWPDSPIYEKCERVMAGELERAQLEWLPAGEAFYRCLITPLTEKFTDGSKRIIGCILVMTDVSDMRIAQEQLRESYEERSKLLASETAAIEASRLKSEFVANTSHETRTPVAGIIGLAELLLDDPTLPEQHRSSVAKIMRSGEILLEMIGMVLDMGKVEAGRLDLENRPFRIDEIIADARMFSVSAEKKGVNFEEDFESFYLGQVSGDMPRLRQVLANLLSNAIKFTKQGKIVLRVRQDDETQSQVTLRFEVEDTGVGIREEAIPMLFRPFHQADASTARQFGGTGLGLCIAKNLIMLMGGTIDLSSKFGVGTKMTVVVPLEKTSSMISETDQSPLNLPGADLVRENVWILVTDDNELNREIITRTLTKMRFNVESASNGLEAIEAVQRRRFDLVLMDGQMDTMDGYEATRRIRSMSDPNLKAIKIIALTASAIQGDEERCLRAGMNGYLAKPVRAKVLEATILRHLAAMTPPVSTPLIKPSLSRKSSSTTPGIETAMMMSLDFPDTITEPRRATTTSTNSHSSPNANEEVDHPGVGRRRPSHPSYGMDAVP